MLVFTAGIGENSSEIRRRVCYALGFLGVKLDTAAKGVHAPAISTTDSPVRVCVEATNEEWIAATEAQAILAARQG